MFVIILDTNVFTADWHLRSVAAQACLEMCKKTGSLFLMPRLVLEELQSQYEEKLSKQIADYNQRAHSLNRFFANDKVRLMPEIDVKAESQKYIRDILSKLGMKRKSVLDYPTNILPKLVDKAIHRIRPFSNNGEEFRDALLWETVKANLCPDGVATTVFISQDNNAFVDKNDPLKPLHPILIEEVEIQRVSNEITRKEFWLGNHPYFEFYGSLKAFASQHFQHVEHINMHWIDAVVSKSRLKMILDECQKYQIKGMNDGAVKLIKNIYGSEMINFAVSDSWLYMKQYSCDFIDFTLYNFSQDNYGLILETTGKFLLCVYGNIDDFNSLPNFEFFEVGFKVEFGLGVTRNGEGSYQVDYSEFPSFEPDVKFHKRAKLEGISIIPSQDKINEAIQDLLVNFQK